MLVNDLHELPQKGFPQRIVRVTNGSSAWLFRLEERLNQLVIRVSGHSLRKSMVRKGGSVFSIPVDLRIAGLQPVPGASRQDIVQGGTSLLLHQAPEQGIR